MKRIFAIAALALSALLVMASTASASVAPNTTWTPTAGSFNSANAPGSSHLTSGTVQCVVDANLNINCDTYVLGGVGNTNANLSLVATYNETISCTNNGRQLVEAQTKTTSATPKPLKLASQNGQMTVPPIGVTAPSGTPSPNPCPNRNWTATIQSVTLTSFDYKLTFVGFNSPYIEITAS